jgi:hypothetical protein
VDLKMLSLPQILGFAESYFSNDQGPQIVMIENYRTRVNLGFVMSCPEVKAETCKIGFQRA